jgi:sulfatase modifying factor 1
MNQPLSWCSFSSGANWRHPQGRQSTNRDLDNHPVVHIAYRDADA